MRRIIIATIATMLSSTANAEDLSGIDFIVNFRDLAGKSVTIADCMIAGTTASFIRCETSNGAASYTLETKTMDRADLAWSYNTCPTGSVRKTECRRVSVSGIVKKANYPELLDAKFNKH